MLHLTTETNKILNTSSSNIPRKIFVCPKCAAIYEFYVEMRYLCECGATLPRIYNMQRSMSDKLKYHIKGKV
jgi:hypothetical protein